MQAVQTYVANQQVLAAELNDIQTRAAGLVTGNANNAHDTLGDGLVGIEWMYGSADLAAGTLVKIDGTADFRDRMLTVVWSVPSGSDQEPGGVNDYLLDYTPTLRRGYTGRGALDAGSNAPSAGNPPVPAAGTSWALQITTNVWLYATPSTGSLYLYNGTGSAIRRPTLTVHATGKTGKRP